MAVKPPDLLNRIPSVSELLEKPPIRALVDRWNRSSVAGGVRSFLDELRADFERRAGEIPSIRELAERAARYVISRQHHSLGVAINATGRICGSPWTSTPLAEPALERMIALGRDFATAATDGTENASVEPETSLCRLTGAQAAAVSHSYSGAIWLALAALAANREVVVARAEVGDVDGVDSLHKLAAAANVALKEVGATNRTSIADYEAVLSPQTAAILKLSNDSYRVVGEIVATQLDDIVPLARDRELTPIDSLGMAPLIDLPAQINWPRRSAQASIAAGADLVILRGDALVGGPACGLLLGRSDLIRRVKEHPLFSACQIEPLRAAALTATLACYENQPPSAEAIPVWQCLRISVDNLRNRADRMAAQLSHVEGLSSAAAVETQSPVSAALAQEWPSYGVAITPADGNLPALNDRLLASRIPIRGRVEADRIILDLRTVLPRQDKTIVDSLLGSN